MLQRPLHKVGEVGTGHDLIGFRVFEHDFGSEDVEEEDRACIASAKSAESKGCE